MPITSWPAATQRAAATALSTPPLMATTTRSRGRTLGRRFSSRLRHEDRQELEDAVDVGRGGGRPDAEPHPAPRRYADASHGEEHVRGLGGSCGARRAERDRHAGKVEEDEEALAGAAWEGDVERVREPRPLGRTVPHHARRARAEPRPQPLDEPH